MREILRSLLDAAASGRPLCYCRLVETRGSTPQKAGAAMLVFSDGSQAGTLGGGCVEADVKRRALALLTNDRPEVLTFQLDSDYGWDDGLICGGRMQILVEPLTSPEHLAYFHQLDSLLQAGTGCTEAVVFDADRSGLPAAASYLFDEAGRLAAHQFGPLDEGDAPRLAREHLPLLADRPQASAAHGVAYLPNLPRCRLLIVGGGHVGQAVGGLASQLDFDVWVVDDREEYVTPERFPTAAKRIAVRDLGKALADIEVTPNTYCLIVTRGHNHDQEALWRLVDRGARYVGMIGSRRKIKLIFDGLESEGIDPELLARVYAPVGIDIGSQTVTEIAVSIVAELVSHRNRQGEVPGRPAPILALGDPDRGVD